MNRNNFINVVGYQLEKVHTGVIKWMLDTENQEIALKDKYVMIERLYDFAGKKINYKAEDMAQIICYPEYSFGRNIKIDLVIKIDLHDGDSQYIVIEMKVDSIPGEEQLKNTYERMEGSFKDNALYFLFLLGTSQVSTVPESRHNFHVCMVEDIIKIFTTSSCTNKIYRDWMEALGEERGRWDHVIHHLHQTRDTFDEYFWDRNHWESLGYRTWFPLLYYIYDHLRQHLDKGRKWNIYSGSNNPVMNWDQWLTKEVNGHEIQFYWEFNYEKLLLKIYLDPKNPMSRQDFDRFRERLYKICQMTKRKGQSTQKRFGTYNSVYKWPFNFKEEGLNEIALATDQIINLVHKELEKL